MWIEVITYLKKTGCWPSVHHICHIYLRGNLMQIWPLIELLTAPICYSFQRLWKPLIGEKKIFLWGKSIDPSHWPISAAWTHYYLEAYKYLNKHLLASKNKYECTFIKDPAAASVHSFNRIYNTSTHCKLSQIVNRPTNNREHEEMRPCFSERQFV